MHEAPGNDAAKPGEVAVEQPAHGVLVFRIRGRMEPEHVNLFEMAAAPYVERHEVLDLFFDTSKMTGYHPRFRERMTAWHEQLKPFTRSAHVLMTSKLVAMAIAVANLVTGGMLKTHADPDDFQGELTQAVRARSR